MTTTPTASPELLDLDKLEALFQARVEPWMAACFGPRISADTTERNHRFIEEALELVQAGGMSKADVLQLVDYTYGRPIGELHQEVGGVMVTLAALCLAQGLDMHDAAEVELARIWTKVEAIRAKQLTKPRGSPLPAPAATLSPLCGAQHAESGKEADAAEKAAAYDELNRIAELHGFASAAAAIAAARRAPQQATAAPRIIGGQPWSKEAEMTEGWLAAQQAAAPGAKLMTYDEFFAEARRLGCKLPADVCAALAAAPDYSAPGTPEAPQTAAARDVLAERQRQMQVEGWTLAHDDQYRHSELAHGAAAYALVNDKRTRPACWPWAAEWWKPLDDRRNLVRAGALVLAEIERLDRAAQLDGGQEGSDYAHI